MFFFLSLLFCPHWCREIRQDLCFKSSTIMDRYINTHVQQHRAEQQEPCEEWTWNYWFHHFTSYWYVSVPFYVTIKTLFLGKVEINCLYKKWGWIIYKMRGLSKLLNLHLCRNANGGLWECNLSSSRVFGTSGRAPWEVLCGVLYYVTGSLRKAEIWTVSAVSE